ncbi:predicted protein [Nematostella vectensis]|uniref:EGF-like domain-containing protein n=1 Tax=Nematostella vectensis TaxID=45351 RepID=A7T0D7_NEMVE|nr:predicted protein [Nematostella vectensis]|eukprot:XP_001622692.1 predicted protein [Nematostella vectensis]
MSPNVIILLVICVVAVSGNHTPGVITIAKFLKDLSKRLDVPIIDSHLVKSEGLCSARCVRNRECVSYNLKKKQTTSCDENILCELLNTDKFNETTAFKSSVDFDYFYPPSKCVKSPCKNGGSCRTIYSTNSYHCICTPGWTGANRETLMVCGSILRGDPNTKDMTTNYPVPAGWLLCYIDDRDTAHHATPCHDLIVNIPGYVDSQALLDAGGNFGCWHGYTGPSPGPSYATNNIIENGCVDGRQHTSTWRWVGNGVTFGVCIRTPA